MSDNEEMTMQASRLHNTIRSAVRTERAAIHTIAHGLAEMRRTQLCKELGYASIYEYAEAETSITPLLVTLVSAPRLPVVMPLALA